jgi:hypothetical protein
MFHLDRKSNNRGKSVVAVLAVLVVAASATALASSLGVNLVRTASAELPSIPHINNHLALDMIHYGPVVGGNVTTGNETATTGNETATTGNETATTGNETATTGNETIDNSTG